MGMYTEILVKADVSRNLPPLVHEVLDYLFNSTCWQWPDKELPAHEFFKCPRWQMIGSCSSYYHIPWTDSKYSEGRIFSRSDLKNYNDEIEKFFNWIEPYLNEPKGKCIGYSWYEEDMQPDWYYKKTGDY